MRWGSNAAETLQVHVTRLLLVAEPDAVDAVRFDWFARDARTALAGDPQRAGGLVREALGL